MFQGFGSKKLDQCKTKHIDRYKSFEMGILIFENYFLILPVFREDCTKKENTENLTDV